MKAPDTIRYPFEQQPGPGETLELAAGVRWLRMPLPFELNHINLWLLEEEDGWTIVETGIALDDIKANREAVLATHCREKPVKRILVTHCHPDHLGLARWLGHKLQVGTWITQGEMLNAYAWFHQLPNYDVDGMVGFFRRHGLDAARAGSRVERGPASLRAPFRKLLHWTRSNTRARGRINVSKHYDLGDEFFALFLDPTMMYSCAEFDQEDPDLERASVRKIDRICEQLELAPGDDVLEIGTGWGGFALQAASKHG